MVVQNRVRGVDPPVARETEKQQRYIRNDMSVAQKQTIGIPRASRNIVRELKELDEVLQSAGRLDDDSVRSTTGGNNQRDKYLVEDTHVADVLPVVGRSSSSRASRKKPSKSRPNFRRSRQKTVLLSVTIENSGNPVRSNNKLPSPDIDFILSDLNRAVSTVQGDKSPGRAVPMTPRYRTPVTSRAKTKEPTASAVKESKSIKHEAGAASQSAEKPTASHASPDKNDAPKNILETDEWNPFDSSTFVTSWAFEEKFNKPFPSFKADFDSAFVISSQLSI